MALGVILTPYGANSPTGWYAEIAQARGGNGSYLQQSGYPHTDRFFHSRGEPGFYYDTQLGAWQPRTRAGVVVKAWWDRLLKREAPIAPAGPRALPAGDGMTPTDAELAINTKCYTPVHSGWINAREGFVPGTWRFNWNPAGAYGPQTSLGEGQDLIALTNEHNKRMFRLAVISTTAVSISALFALWTRWKRLRLDLKRKGRR